MSRRVLLYFVIVIGLFLFNFYFRPIKGNKLVTSEYKNSSSYINDLYMSDEYFKKSLLNEDSYVLYDEIVKASLDDKYSVTINCGNSCSYFTDAYRAIYLDHPELISFLGISAYYDEGTSIRYTNYQNLGKFRSYFGTRRIAREMENIRKDTKDMSDKEKIIYVYDYVASHNYDRLFTYSGSNQSAYSFFTKQSSVCAGFAKASQIIFQNIGISSYLVMNEEHMWNYVEYEDNYYVFDATVGASYSDKKSERFYDGLGMTTVGDKIGYYASLYPKIVEEPTLKGLFGL